MAIDRSLWTQTFKENDPPSWACPTCGLGSLASVKGSFKIEETRASSDAHQEDGWEPDWIQHRFIGMLKCSRTQCGDIVIIAGDTVSEEYYEPDPSNPYNYIDYGVETRLRPRYVLPAPALFRMPPDTPEDVRDEIIGAFQLFWTDYGACANKLRSALEALMDHFNVKKTAINRKNKRVRVDLHGRIELFRTRAPDVADHLLAAKWIGNTGVHAGRLNDSDIFDALDMIEFALDELIAKRSSQLKKIAKAITKRRAPRGPKRS